jgi:hypothetical protein
MKGFQQLATEEEVTKESESTYHSEFIPRNVDIKTIKQTNKKCKSEQNYLFKQLKILKKGKDDHVTRKFLRVILIRGHKRILRNIFVGKLPRDSLNKQEASNESQLNAFDQLSKHFKENLKILKKTSKTHNGPLSDGKTQRERNRDASNVEKSYNKQFAANYFSDDIVRESFRLYIIYLFEDTIPNLIKKYGFTCCDEVEHEENCEEIWFMLKQILTNNFS